MKIKHFLCAQSQSAERETFNGHWTRSLSVIMRATIRVEDDKRPSSNCTSCLDSSSALEAFQHGEFVYDARINYPRKARKNPEKWNLNEKRVTWNRYREGKSAIFLTVSRRSENVNRRRPRAVERETLMMFEFEKIILIDGRWKEEIDQIRFWWRRFPSTRGECSFRRRHNQRFVASISSRWGRAIVISDIDHLVPVRLRRDRSKLFDSNLSLWLIALDSRVGLTRSDSIYPRRVQLSKREKRHKNLNLWNSLR